MRVLADVLVVRCADECVDGHAFRELPDIPAEHLSHRNIPIEYRRADTDRSNAIRRQQESLAGGFGLQDRRILKPDEASHGFAFFHSREKFQIGAG